MTRRELIDMFNSRHPGTVHLIKQFAWGHLPSDLQRISAPSGNLAVEMVRGLPDGPELSAGLRHLLEAKDCFVRAGIED